VVAVDEGFPRVCFGVQSSVRGIVFVSDRWIRRQRTVVLVLVVVVRFAVVIDWRIISGGSIFGIRVPKGFRDETARGMI
jgi:hypothetical protein